MIAANEWGRHLAILETGTQSAATCSYRGAVGLRVRQRRVKMTTLYLSNLTRYMAPTIWRHVKPMEIVMHQLRQTAVELPGTCQNADCCIHRSHAAVCWWWPSEPRRERHYSSPPVTLQRRGGQVSPQTPRWASAGYDVVGNRRRWWKQVVLSTDMLFQAEVGRDDNSKHSDVLLRRDNINIRKLQRWKGIGYKSWMQPTSRTRPEQLGLI